MGRGVLHRSVLSVSGGGVVSGRSTAARGGVEMTALWSWIAALLTSLSADPHAMDVEVPKAAAAVSVAYASFAVEK